MYLPGFDPTLTCPHMNWPTFASNSANLSKQTVVTLEYSYRHTRIQSVWVLHIQAH